MTRFSVLILLTASTVGLAQEHKMPAPGPEHKAISAFAGKWSFEGKAEAGPMGPGGPVTFTETCEMFEGGFALVCRSEGKNPMGPTKTIAIMSYDTDKKAYTYYAVESGFPAFTATGKNVGKAWNWETVSKMGDQTVNTAVTVTLTSPTSQTFEMKMSTDGGKTWVPAMSGKSTKAGT
jgi:Protein of unknown function (DUF1579)